MGQVGDHEPLRKTEAAFGPIFQLGKPLALLLPID
jgi:hypothetical protein